MKFLQNIAKHVLDKHGQDTGKVTVVFPNRRAGLFFRKYLAEMAGRPLWSPEVLTIEDFVKGFSPLKAAEKLELIYELYTVFGKLNKSDEPFERFYYWGNIMLADFDEADKFMIDTEQLFRNLAHLKNIDNDLSFLEDEQRKVIAEFWKSFGDKLSSHQKGFLRIWDNMFATYSLFRENLRSKGLAYDGMIYREVAETLENNRISMERPVIFVGFNALSKSEERIITHFLQSGKAEIFWDADDFYLNDKMREAGRFLREMRNGHRALGRTFMPSYGNAFAKTDKTIKVYEVTSDTGQAQAAGNLLESFDDPPDVNTAVILPDNNLLFPLLHALPQNADKLNVTMGYPLSSSTVYNLLDALISLQVMSEGKKAYHFRPVLTVLLDPLLASIDGSVRKKADAIIEKNMVWVPHWFFDGSHEILAIIFSDFPDDLPQYLREVLLWLSTNTEDKMEREFFYHFYTVLNKLAQFIAGHRLKLSREGFQKLFRQMVRNERLPFEGEPLLGLQVMGILESRNLDFDNVIIMSASEGVLPPATGNVSFIPYSIRKAYGLPETDHHDAMHAYVFYRLMQRAKRVFLIYNTSEENTEVSRFVRQIAQETDIIVEYATVSSAVTIEDPRQITVEKSAKVMDRLFDFTSKKDLSSRFSPSALNSYLDCPLKFYFRYVQELYEKEEMAEEVDAMVFGNIMHQVMEALYRPFDRDDRRMVTAEDVKALKKEADEKIAAEFAHQFGEEGEDFHFEGQNLLAREIIRKMVLKVLDYDLSRAPFELLGVEAGEKKGIVMDIALESYGLSVGLKGIIDRIERKDGVVRIVDYKTGRDDKSFDEIAKLFDKNEKNRKKAVFQTFLYSLLYLNSSQVVKEASVQASLFNIRDLFADDFTPLIQQKAPRGKGREVEDVRPFLSEFGDRLTALLEEIFDQDTPFAQTEDVKKCLYCPYRGICNR